MPCFALGVDSVMWKCQTSSPRVFRESQKEQEVCCGGGYTAAVALQRKLYDTEFVRCVGGGVLLL